MYIHGYVSATSTIVQAVSIAIIRTRILNSLHTYICIHPSSLVKGYDPLPSSQSCDGMGVNSNPWLAKMVCIVSFPEIVIT